MVLDCVRLLAAVVHVALSGREKAVVLRPPRELWSRQARARKCWSYTTALTHTGCLPK